MCYYPKLIKNRKYIPNKKNGGNIPPVTDERVKYVAIGCQNCRECRKQKARGWQVRLLEDIQHHKDGKFITLTFSNESIKELSKECTGKGYQKDNAIATLAVRRFLERWRKEYKKSLRHWLVTEIGHNGTENIHLHGIVWTSGNLEDIERHWKYGIVWKGKKENGRVINYVSEKTVNYIVKYVTKLDEKHKHYKAIVLTSPGIGRNYTKRIDAFKNRYKPGETNETYRTRTGHKIAMPIYWRNKIYNDDEREKLWIEKLDKQERWVGGEKIDISKGIEDYYGVLKHYRRINIKLGYGTDEKNWTEEQYERERRIIMQETRIKKAIRRENNKKKKEESPPPIHGRNKSVK